MSTLLFAILIILVTPWMLLFTILAVIYGTIEEKISSWTQ